MKKKVKKNARKHSGIGRNIYGQRCITKFVKLEKETALEQYMDILTDLDSYHVHNIEYTVDCSCFNDEERIAFNNKLSKIMELRVGFQGYGFVTGTSYTGQISA